MQFGGSGVEKVVLDWIDEQSPKYIVEFGSGSVSTPYFISKGYAVTSIENDPLWLFNTRTVKYVFAPIVDGWYSRKSIESARSLLSFADLYLIDGPGCMQRDGLLNHLDLFNLSAAWVFHDADREDVKRMAESVAFNCGRAVTFWSNEDEYATIKGASE